MIRLWQALGLNAGTKASSDEPVIGMDSPIYLRVNGLASLIIWPFSIALAFFVCQPWAPDVFGVPIQVILVWSCFLWVIMFHPSSLVRTGMIFSPFQWILISLLVGSAFLRAYLDGWQAIRLIQICTGLMIAVLGSMIFRTRRGRRAMFGTLALSAVASSSFAIMQYIDFAPWLWELTRYSQVGSYVYGSTGMEGTPVSFSFSVLGIGVVLASSWLLFNYESVKLLFLPTGIQFLCCAIIAAGLLFSKSRSGLLGFTVGVVVILLITSTAFLRERRQMTSDDPSESRGKRTRRGPLRSVIRFIILVSLTGAIVCTGISQEEVFSDMRILTNWKAYLPIVLTHPVGLPGNIDLTETLGQINTNDSIQQMERSSSRVLAPHNIILSTGITLGPLAAAALVALYGSCLIMGIRGLRAFRSAGHKGEAFWISVFLAVNIAIITHSWFHNASIAMGEMRNWLWVGLLQTVVTHRICNHDRRAGWHGTMERVPVHGPGGKSE